MEPNQKTPAVSQPTTPVTTATIINLENKPKKSHKVLFFLLGIFVVLILVGGIGGGYYFGRSSITKELNPSSPAIPPKDPDVYKGTPTPSPSLTPIKILKSEDLYSINLPEGWKKISEEENVKGYELIVNYENGTGDFLIIGINPLGSGFASDQIWWYEPKNENKGLKITKQIKCDNQESIFCSMGDNKLQIAIKPSDEKYGGVYPINKNSYFFLVGNNNKETDNDNQIYKNIIESIEFN